MNLGRRSAFALVELLVTIAIIGIPLKLLLPDLAAVQATAKAGAQAAYDEVRDDIYLSRLRTILRAGGGSAE